jgi:hypothetical protein
VKDRGLLVRGRRSVVCLGGPFMSPHPPFGVLGRNAVVDVRSLGDRFVSHGPTVTLGARGS